ncbi:MULTISPECIES: nickel-dependent hydrogenase large subunit [unclassified Clostridium]|uniref:nickel-dependent hydrogenase large subunit n=1 Tax=unclassified Clostridium TaxID=2614128 RepID=UPI000EEA9DD7|nr:MULTISPECIES: nickel-dependent hydrogenase large subunit [unclassified Clostridium]HCQ89309.1 Ni/Fe hydrogenase [Clostridium sp.]
MGKKVVINPMTRISGFLQIEVEIENNKVIEAKSQGMLFRGFEKMLKGRNPSDAIYFTERICGICSTAHSIGSARALERAFNVEVPPNENIIRNILHGCEFLQNHLRHFYQYTLPDYVSGFNIDPLYEVNHDDFRIPEDRQKRLIEDYFISTEYSKRAHKLLALLGGKAPHNHGVFLGGITVTLDAEKLLEAKAMLSEMKSFITNRMVEDIETISKYYEDYFKIGASQGNFMSFGLFDDYGDMSYVKPKIILKDGKEMNIDKDKITENIYKSWYVGEKETFTFQDERWTPDSQKKEGYTWIKAPRYEGVPMEVGPLARMYISGVYKKDSSTMSRLVARVLEAKKVAETMESLLNIVELKAPSKKNFVIPEKAIGYGLQDTTRGTLAHFIGIEAKQIDKYTIITPSTWNLSPKDDKGVRGAIEEALVGSHIQDFNNPVEVGRIVRSFDPCVSCATHVVSKNASTVEIRVV